jgi:hypothetical protein
MQVGDLVISKNRYKGQLFIVIGYIATGKPKINHPVVQCFRVADGYKTRWSAASTWEVICE